MYHTQEKRFKVLTEPAKCENLTAWLGPGWYFWNEYYDADKWGKDSKRSTGSYEIYEAYIQSDNILDTVFNEVEYNFWVRQIEKIAQIISSNVMGKPTLKHFNEYLRKNEVSWNQVDGILFQDIPRNSEPILINDFFYRKRIQLQISNLKIVNNFKLLETLKTT